MIELTQDHKLWLNVLLGLEEVVKHEITLVLDVCADNSTMHDEDHPKYVQYANGITAIKGLLAPLERRDGRRPRFPKLKGRKTIEY